VRLAHVSITMPRALQSEIERDVTREISVGPLEVLKSDRVKLSTPRVVKHVTVRPPHLSTPWTAPVGKASKDEHNRTRRALPARLDGTEFAALKDQLPRPPFCGTDTAHPCAGRRSEPPDQPIDFRFN
jgi:hypothetical protein